jgi:glycosyltransferase involved in cell wall biosynthesis
VNDSTPDDSIKQLLDIIEQYPQRKNQIKIIHHSQNKGLATTRNTALNNSNGEYISVVDSDDYIEPEMIEVLYEKAKAEDADIVICDFFMEYKNSKIFCHDFLSNESNDHLGDLIKNEHSESYLWNKLVRRALYDNFECRVPKGLNYLEDRHVMIRLFYYAKKITKINKPYYHYNKYNDYAITKTKTRMHFENTVQFWNLLDEFLTQKNEFEKYRSILELSKVRSKLQLMFDTHSTQLRIEYAYLFRDFELQYFNYFKFGEKLMLLLIHNKMFCLAQLFHNYLIIKNKINYNK